ERSLSAPHPCGNGFMTNFVLARRRLVARPAESVRLQWNVLSNTNYGVEPIKIEYLHIKDGRA
ncbi:MAG: hypothetical protein RR595_07605, partial [Lysinibacillus sp.]